MSNLEPAMQDEAKSASGNTRRPGRNSYQPRPETLALLKVSGNPINGLGETEPRRPSPFVLGTICVCRWGTLWLTVLLIATNVPCAPSAAGMAALISWTAAKYGLTRVAGRSASVTKCALGTASTCPGNTGLASRKATVVSSASTTRAGTVPAAMAQNVQSVILAR